MQNVHQVIHKWPFTAFTILHAECSSDAYKTDEHSTWRMFIRCTLTCAILQMLSHLKSGKQRNGYRSIHTSVKSLKSWNSNAFIFSAQKSRQNLNELNCVRILARTAKLNAASNSRKSIDVIVFRVLPVYYLFVSEGLWRAANRALNLKLTILLLLRQFCKLTYKNFYLQVEYINWTIAKLQILATSY